MTLEKRTEIVAAIRSAMRANAELLAPWPTRKPAWARRRQD